jgi:GntR family transcriptional regulator, transcriptional repressor for pyruvate dehydrogenase complex
MVQPARRPQKTAMIIARRIVDDIRRGGYTVGDRLPAEKPMLEAYQIGRGTLREALRFLELQGVISLKPGPGGGPTVEKPDAGSLATSLVLLLQFEGAPFSTIVEARSGLEPVMARLAAARMGKDEVKALTDSVDQMRENLGDQEIFLQTNRDFHETIAWASGNSLFGFLIDALIGIVDGTSLGVDYPDTRRTAILVAHTRILDALLLQDGDISEASMQAHMNEYSKYLRKKYPDVLAQPVTWDLI